MLAKVDSLEEEHACVDRHHEEVERLGQLWLQQGQLSNEDAARFSTLVNQLSDLYRRHLGIEDREVFPFAASVLSAVDREAIGSEMAARRGLGARTLPAGVTSPLGL